MTSVTAPSPLLALADPSFGRTGQAGDGFAPVLASLLAPAAVLPIAPAIGTAVPLPGKPLPAGDGMPDLFEDLGPPRPTVGVQFKEPGAGAELPLAGEVAPPRPPGAAPTVVAESAPAPVLPVDEPSSPSRAAPPSDVEAAPRPLSPTHSMPRLDVEAAPPPPPPPAGAGEQPVLRSPAPRPQATPEADQGGIKPTVVAGIPTASLPERKEASPSLPKSAAGATTGPGSDRPTKADGPPAAIALPAPPVAPAAAPEAPTTTSTATAAATVRSPAPAATIEIPSIKTDHAPRPARFAPPAREAAPVSGDAEPPALAATDAPEKSERDEQVATVEPVPPPSGEQAVVAAAIPPPVPSTPLPDTVRAEAVVVATRATGRVAASPLPVVSGADPVGREGRGAVGERAFASPEPVPAAPAAPVASVAPAPLPPRVTPPVTPGPAPVASRPAPLRKQDEPVVGATVVVTPERPEPVSSVATVLPAAAPVVQRAVASEPVPVAVPEPAVRVVGAVAPPLADDVQTPAVRATAATPAEPSPAVPVEPRPDTPPRPPARVAPVAQPRVELAAPVILPAFQAFGAQLHRAAAAERRPLPAIDASVLVAPTATPVAVPTEPAPVDLTRPDWPQAMVARIEQLRERHDETDTRIRLHPDALGAVEVTLRRDAEGTHVRLDAAEPATARLLADAQPRLQALAETRGLRLAGSEVAGGSAQGSTGGWSGNDRRPPAPAPFAPARRPAADTPEDSADTRLA